MPQGMKSRGGKEDNFLSLSLTFKSGCDIIDYEKVGCQKGGEIYERNNA